MKLWAALLLLILPRTDPVHTLEFLRIPKAERGKHLLAAYHIWSALREKYFLQRYKDGILSPAYRFFLTRSKTDNDVHSIHSSFLNTVRVQLPGNDEENCENEFWKELLDDMSYLRDEFLFASNWVEILRIGIRKNSQHIPKHISDLLPMYPFYHNKLVYEIWVVCEYRVSDKWVPILDLLFT